MDLYQQFIYTRTYSRYLEDEKRRETFNETVNRYSKFFEERIPKENLKQWQEVISAIKNLDVMPSMRALWTAGEALKRENLAGFNCSYLAVDTPKAFADTLYILMNGTGVGFSVERQVISKLPTISDTFKNVDEVITVQDSKLGWAEAFNRLIELLYDGKVPKFDFSLVREKGKPLKVFGGRASGPEPLKELFNYTINIFKNAKGRKLYSIECHDILCFTAKIVVVGGVRRSACISLSNRSDNRMAHAKDGQFWNTNAQRFLANNSIAYTEKPTCAEFMKDWLTLIESNSGERGIFNRESANYIVERIGRRKVEEGFGCNPCSEIILRNAEVCNLSEVVIRKTDSLNDLRKKVQYATIIGCVQSTLENFNFLSDKWKENIVEERLLGVSLTGLRDHEVLCKCSDTARTWLSDLKSVAIQTAHEWSNILNINMPTAITCCKPSGTVSQLVNSASGLHPRYSKYYIRRVRVNTTDPLFKMMNDKGFKWNPEVSESRDTCNTAVFDFPIKSPDNAIVNDDVTALEQLNYWKMIQKYWCEHKPSITVFVKDNEWFDVGSWVYKNWKWVSGISFLPFDGGVYQLAPYESITEKQYNELLASQPEIDFNDLYKWELEDATQGSREFACHGGKCEL